MSHFRNVIFDLDGLLTDTEPVHHRAFNLVLQATGADFQFDQVEYGRIMTGRSVLENAEYVRERFALAADAVLFGGPERIVVLGPVVSTAKWTTIGGST